MHTLALVATRGEKDRKVVTRVRVWGCRPWKKMDVHVTVQYVLVFSFFFQGGNRVCSCALELDGCARTNEVVIGGWAPDYGMGALN